METIKLDGRQFRSITQALTASQDDYILAHLRLSGAFESDLDYLRLKRTTEDRAEALLTQLLLSGRNHYILAGCLTEEGKVWSRTSANANAARFSEITDAGEKSLMMASIVQFVIGVVRRGEALSEASDESSSRSAEVSPTENAAPSTLRH